jgi:hypothetical protein
MFGPPAWTSSIVVAGACMVKFFDKSITSKE